MAKPVLTVILGQAELVKQRAHLAKGAFFLPEPEPLPEPFVEIVLHVENALGKGVDLDARILQILEGRGIAVAFDNPARAKAALAPLFDAADATVAGVDDDATFIFWGRGRPVSDRAEPALLKTPGADVTHTQADPLPAAMELNETATLEKEIATMSLNQKMQLAMKGDYAARALLLKDPNKNIQSFIIQNPRITLDEVKYLAGFRQANPDVLNAIAAHRDWTQNPSVVTALVRNPKTPGSTAVRMMEKLPVAEIRRLAKANDAPPSVMAAARKKIVDPGARG